MIYIIRDCITQEEKDNIVIGRRNIELDDYGKQKLQALKEKLKDIKFAEVHASPLIRNKQIVDELNIDAPIKYDDRINERSFGQLEGKEILDITKLPIWRPHHINRWGVENLSDVKRRTMSYLREKLMWYKITKCYDKNILVITHNSIIACIRAYVEGKPENNHYYHYFIDSDTIMTYDPKNIKMGDKGAE